MSSKKGVDQERPANPYDAFASFPLFCFALVVFNMPYRSQAVWDGGLR